MSANLLVELFTEELPPKALKRLGEAFGGGIQDVLIRAQLKTREPHGTQFFATPRRLAVLIPDVLPKSQDRVESRKLMPSKVAFDADGKPTTALAKRLEKEGASERQLERKNEGNTEYVFLNQTLAGITLASGLQIALNETIAKLPIPKLMSYQLADGATTVQFVRPAHGLVALHGTDVVPVTALGLAAGRVTHGHRFQGVKDIPLATADAYAEALAAHGNIIASFDERRADIARQLAERAAALKTSLGAEADYAPLLEEVTALVEYPTVYAGEFESEFLAVPPECLVLTMRQNQKYFPLFDAAGKLINKFLIVSNMRLVDPKNIVEGNQRVVRPRLADARFFFETDKKTRLADRVPQLAKVVYHNKLGSQLDRVGRVRELAVAIAKQIGADAALADRAALLAKTDLATNMVGEFPELQGVMGRYYALADGEDARVAEAIGDQYRIRYDDHADPANLVSMSLFVADRVETIVGIWGIGLQPTGEKDPFGLRRAALGLISAFEMMGAMFHVGKRPFTLQLNELLQQSATLFKPGTLGENLTPEILEFVYERYRNQLLPLYDRNAVDAVIALTPPLNEVVARVQAVIEFVKLPEASPLAAANKRIGNILKKATVGAASIDASLLTEGAEKDLAAAVDAMRPDVQARFAAGDYAGTLKVLAQAKAAVDAFFNEVMVMAEDAKLRDNRIALLRNLHDLMNQVADISKLAA
jgi:glycyl-tRNA synthetase beta chain